MWIIVGSGYDETVPVPEAIERDYIRIDERTISDPAGFPFPADREDWYARGANHRVEHSHIKRDLSDKTWFVKVTSLKQLTELFERYPKSSLEKAFVNPSILQLRLEPFDY